MSRAAEDMLDGIRTILRAFTIDERRFPSAEGRIKYNPVDFQALYYIEENSGCKGNELAAFLGIPPTTAQSVSDRLIKRDLVERGDNSSSRRAIALSLTSEGQEVVAAIRRQDLANCNTMLSALPTADRKRFAAQILQIASSLSDEA